MWLIHGSVLWSDVQSWGGGGGGGVVCSHYAPKINSNCHNKGVNGFLVLENLGIDTKIKFL